MKKSLLLPIFLFLFVFSFAFGATKKITKIEVLNNKIVPREVLLKGIDSKVGEDFSVSLMISDFKILKENKFLDSVIIKPTSFENGVKLNIEVVEKTNARELLNKDGLYSLSDLDTLDTNYKIASVRIEGQSVVPEQELLEKIGIRPGQYFSKNKVMEGQHILLETGLFRAVEPEAHDHNGVVIVYHVLENPKIKGITITGNTIFSTETLQAEMKSKVGDVISIEKLKEDRDMILMSYRDLGYTLSEVLEMSMNDNEELELVIAEGIIKKVEFKKMVTKRKGERRNPKDDVLKTADYLIEREIRLKEGEIFNVSNYDQTVMNLMRLGYFKNIKNEVKVSADDPAGREITLLIDEGLTAGIQGSLSYGTESGFGAMLSLKDDNFLGKGQSIGFSFEKTQKDFSSININFYEPWIRGTDRISFGANAYRSQSFNSESPVFNTTRFLGGSFNFGKGLTDNLHLSLGSKIERIEEFVSEDFQKKLDNPSDPLTDPKDGRYNDKYMNYSVFPYLTYDNRNNYLNPTGGEYAKLQTEVGYATGYEAAPFWNATLELRKYHPGFFEGNTFAYRATMGIMSPKTKESKRFWIGGGSTLRGYDLGHFRGTSKFILNLENRTEINEVFGIIVFSDIGRAWKYSDGSHRDTGYNERLSEKIGITAGVGLKITSPVGPLRFDFGWPLDPNFSGDKGMRFYFNMGHSF